MKLYSVHIESSVTKSHHKVVFIHGGYDQVTVHGFGHHGPRVIMCGLETGRHALKKILIRVLYFREGRYAVQDTGNVEEPGSVHFTDTLQSEANAEDALFRSIGRNHLVHDPRLVRYTGTRGEQDLVISRDVPDRDLVIPVNVWRVTERTHDVNQVEGK